MAKIGETADEAKHLKQLKCELWNGQGVRGGGLHTLKLLGVLKDKAFLTFTNGTGAHIWALGFRQNG